VQCESVEKVQSDRLVASTTDSVDVVFGVPVLVRGGATDRYKDGMQNRRNKIGDADLSRLEGLGSIVRKLSQQSVGRSICRSVLKGVGKIQENPKIGDPGTLLTWGGRRGCMTPR